MITALLLLYWPVAGLLLLWLYPHKRESGYARQQKFALLTWLAVSLVINQLILHHVSPTNTALRALYNPHGSRDQLLHFLLTLSALIPFLIWRTTTRDQRKQEQN